MFAHINSSIIAESATAVSPVWFIEHTLIRFAMAVAMGLVLSLLYSRVHDRKAKRSFVNTLVVLPLGAAAVTLIIDNNLARAFGLLGAISVIRFRTAIQNTYDMVFVFLSIGLGMACGCALYAIALLSLLVFGLTVIGLRFLNFHKKQSNGQPYYVTLKTSDAAHAMEVFKREISGICETSKFERLTIGNDGDVGFQVTLRHHTTENELLEKATALRNDPISEVRIRKIEKE